MSTMKYVGAIQSIPPQLNLGFSRGSMLWADSVRELYEISRTLGLLDKWVKRDGPRGTNRQMYFWVPENKRRRAVALGARDTWNAELRRELEGQYDASAAGQGLFEPKPEVLNPERVMHGPAAPSASGEGGA